MQMATSLEVLKILDSWIEGTSLTSSSRQQIESGILERAQRWVTSAEVGRESVRVDAGARPGFAGQLRAESAGPG